MSLEKIPVPVSPLDQLHDDILLKLLDLGETGITSYKLFNDMVSHIPSNDKETSIAQMNDVLRKMSSEGIITICGEDGKDKSNHYDIFPDYVIKVVSDKGCSLASLINENNDKEK